jgi:hypothetical protein
MFLLLTLAGQLTGALVWLICSDGPVSLFRSVVSAAQAGMIASIPIVLWLSIDKASVFGGRTSLPDVLMGLIFYGFCGGLTAATFVAIGALLRAKTVDEHRAARGRPHSRLVYGLAFPSLALGGPAVLCAILGNDLVFLGVVRNLLVVPLVPAVAGAITALLTKKAGLGVCLTGCATCFAAAALSSVKLFVQYGVVFGR